MLNDVFKRRRCVSPFPDFKKSETIGLIKVRPNLGFSEKNYDFSEKNEDYSEKNCTKESKGKKSKGKKRKVK